MRVAIDWSIELFFPRDIVLTADVSTPDATPQPVRAGEQTTRTAADGERDSGGGSETDGRR